MFDEEIIKYITNLFNDILYRKGFFDFFKQEGLEAARQFWRYAPYTKTFPPHVLASYEILMNFYNDLGLIPSMKYGEVLEEGVKLHYENTFLRESITQVLLNMYAEGEEKLWDIWGSIIDRQVEMHNEIARNFFELFSQIRADFYGKGTAEPCDTLKKRRQIRHEYVSPVEFHLHDGDGKTVKGVILNISESGLCINSTIPLNKGQVITIKSSLPIRHQTFTVQWTNATMSGLAA